MKNRGFTLIELLAVIVILAIIALIATPIVISIVRESKEQIEFRNVEIYLDTVQGSLMRKTLSNEIDNATCTVLSTGNLDCSGTEVKVEIDNANATDGTIVFKDGEITKIKNLKMNGKYYNYDSNKSLVATEEPRASVCTRGTEGDYDIVTCGAEVFYILDELDGKIKMFAKYNVDVGSSTTTCIDGECTTTTTPATYVQSSTSTNTNFSNNSYWVQSGNYRSGYPHTEIGLSYVYDSNASISKHVNNYKNTLTSIGVEVEEIRLMSYEEVSQLGLFTEIYKSTSPAWSYSTVYWTGVARGKNGQMYYIRTSSTDQYASYANYGACTYNYPGLRPIVIISESEVG